MASGSRKSLKKAQTLLTPPELQGLDAEEIESDNDDDAASVASEQFYENIVCIMYQSIWNLSMPSHQVFEFENWVVKIPISLGKNQPQSPTEKFISKTGTFIPKIIHLLKSSFYSHYLILFNHCRRLMKKMNKRLKHLCQKIPQLGEPLRMWSWKKLRTRRQK